MKLNHLLILVLATLATACSDLADDLQQLGRRVEVLEETVMQANVNISALQLLVQQVEEEGYVTDVVEHTDGSCTIRFSTGDSIVVRNGRDGRDGADGKDGNLLPISVRQAEDGLWYWTLDGDWLLDDEGQRMRASGIDGRDGRDGADGRNGADGKDGKDGRDGKDGQDGKDNPALPVPQVRVNEETGLWEISVNGGYTWTSTGVAADGQDGKDGKDGRDGRDGQDGKDGKDGKDGRDGKDGQDGRDGKDGAADVFADVVVDTDAGIVTFILIDGTEISMPLLSLEA